MKEMLIKAAKEGMEKAYVPFSKFRVGAAILTDSGNIYNGCNIENSSYSLTCCAERTAIFKAVSSGERNFKAMAVIADTPTPVSPCGACRQVMAEFFTDHVLIYLLSKTNGEKTTTIQELLPSAFQLKKENM